MLFRSVKDALVREGVPATSIAVVGKGESALLVPTSMGVVAATIVMVLAHLEWSWIIAGSGALVGLLFGSFAIISSLHRVVLTVMTALCGAAVCVAGLMLAVSTIDRTDLGVGHESAVGNGIGTTGWNDRAAQYRTQAEAAFRAEPEYSFSTQRAAGNSFTFAVQGDSHPERDQKMYDGVLYERTMDLVKAEHPDLYFMLGDDFSIEREIAGNALTQAAVNAVYARQRPFLARMAGATSRRGRTAACTNWFSRPRRCRAASRAKFWPSAAPPRRSTGAPRPTTPTRRAYTRVRSSACRRCLRGFFRGDGCCGTSRG